MRTATCATSTGGSQRLYSGRILDADGIVAVTAELDWPVNRTAVRTGGTDATAWADAVEAFLFADGHTACVYARVDADDDITEVLTARGFAEMATLPEMVCETSLETRADPAGFRVRLAESADDVAGYASVAGEAFAHLAIPADWLEATLTNPDVVARRQHRDCDRRGRRRHDRRRARCRSCSATNRTVTSRWVACADAARGHGLGDAVTRRVTNEGFDRGARLLTLEASPFGRNTYRPHGLPRAVRLPAPHQGVSTPLTPAVGDFVAQIEELLDASDWPDLDRAAVTVTAGDASGLVVLPHRRDPRLNVEVEIDDLHVKIAYGPERVPFTRRDEALRFLEMLGDGRVELVVQRNPVWTSLRSYRDGLALPFRKTSEPWPNLRFRTERFRFGFA